MICRRMCLTAAAALLLCGSSLPVQAGGFAGGLEEAFGPLFKENSQHRPLRLEQQQNRPRHQLDSASWVRHWNSVAIDASGLDHTPVAPGENRVYGEQWGPHRASRAMAIVHIAMYDAVNAIEGQYKSYTGIGRAPAAASLGAAISQAAHDTLAALFPSQTSALDAVLAGDLAQVAEGPMKESGVDVGKRAAAAILTMRANDGSERAEPRVGIEFMTSNDPGKWRQDPISLIPLAVGAYWGEVTPFVMKTTSQFRLPPPPQLDSPEYVVAYNEVKALGGDGIVTATLRTPEQTIIGNYWAYDGTPSLCAPSRLYNQIAMKIAHQMGTDRDVVELARLMALVNVSMADTAMAVWESKFYYQYWRPVTGIREADELTGPTGLGDGNPATVGDVLFTPLGAPASNLTGPNFTPPFPAYPSGHAAFGGTVFAILRMFYGTDRIAFTFVSDEYNGVTRNNDGTVRPVVERRFSSLSQAEEENGQSRIYLGIHWAFDKTAGIAQGHQVADYAYNYAFQPVIPHLRKPDAH